MYYFFVLIARRLLVMSLVFTPAFCFYAALFLVVSFFLFSAAFFFGVALFLVAAFFFIVASKDGLTEGGGVTATTFFFLFVGTITSALLFAPLPLLLFDRHPFPPILAIIPHVSLSLSLSLSSYLALAL